MSRKLSFAMRGTEVVQTTERFDDDGVRTEKSVSVLGERDVVLDQITRQTAEAKAMVDGVTVAGAEQPVADKGKPGTEKTWFLDGKTLFEVETRRRADGLVASVRSRALGPKVLVLANAVERHAELEEMRSGIEQAK